MISKMIALGRNSDRWVDIVTSLIIAHSLNVDTAVCLILPKAHMSKNHGFVIVQHGWLCFWLLRSIRFYFHR